MPEITLEQTVPGTVVPSGAAISPAGQTGPPGQGQNAFTTTSASFVVPPVSQTVVVTMANTGWIVPGQMVWIDQAGGGAGQPGIMLVTAVSGVNVTLQTPPVGAPVPLADPTQSGLLKQVSGNTTDFIDGTNNSQPLPPQIWSVRLRSFNAMGNCNFEVDQRNAGGTTASPVAGTYLLDRWRFGRSTTLTGTISAAQTPAGWASFPVVPGTNFAISKNFLRITMTAAQATLAAGDWCTFYQYIEGINIRELSQDVTSLCLLVRSSVANLIFGLSIDDTPATVSLTRSCTIPTANTWTLIPLPNIPIFPTPSNFSTGSGTVGQVLIIALASGSTYLTPNLNVWQTTTGGFYGPTGMSNFLASPVNSTFDIAFAQWEPGSVCSQLMDLPFDQNIHQCLRYYAASTVYGTKFPSTDAHFLGMYVGNTATYARCGVSYPRKMAKAPTVTTSPGAATTGAVYIDNISASVAVASVGTGDSQMGNINFSATPGGTLGNAYQVIGGWQADTGW